MNKDTETKLKTISRINELQVLLDKEEITSDDIKTLYSGVSYTPKIIESNDGFQIEVARDIDTGSKELTKVQTRIVEKPSKRLFTKMVLSALLVSLCSGVFGGFLVDRFNKEQTVIYQATNQALETSITRNVSMQDLQKQIVEVISTTETSYMGARYLSQGVGSGVIISDNGYIITNHHVVKDASSVMIRDYFGNEYEAEIIGSDEKLDVGVIRVNEEMNLTPATIGDSDTLQVGSQIYVIGNPLGTLGGSVSSGIISAVGREISIDNQYMNLIQTDASINSGNSGGGMFDSNGNLIGIVNAKDSGFTSNGAVIEGLGFAIPINQAIDVAQQIIEFGYPKNRATLGISVYEIGENTQGYTPGLYIRDIASNSAAQKFGLQSGDLIVSVNGAKINNYTDLYRILYSKKAGDVIEIEIQRDNESQTISLELGEYQLSS